MIPRRAMILAAWLLLALSTLGVTGSSIIPTGKVLMYTGYIEEATAHE